MHPHYFYTLCFNNGHSTAKMFHGNSVGHFWTLGAAFGKQKLCSHSLPLKASIKFYLQRYYIHSVLEDTFAVFSQGRVMFPGELSATECHHLNKTAVDFVFVSEEKFCDARMNIWPDKTFLCRQHVSHSAKVL